MAKKCCYTIWEDQFDTHIRRIAPGFEWYPVQIDVKNMIPVCALNIKASLSLVGLPEDFMCWGYLEEYQVYEYWPVRLLVNFFGERLSHDYWIGDTISLCAGCKINISVNISRLDEDFISYPHTILYRWDVEHINKYCFEKIKRNYTNKILIEYIVVIRDLMLIFTYETSRR